MLVDAMTVRMVMQPQSLDTIVATNLHADVLSDLAASIVWVYRGGANRQSEPTAQYTVNV